ncbi:hypothetical protein [Leptolyngbya sp. PCC 6406]|uniref:hypothetical protein n=1 Tax=Leptolyngbya sp. PCC 6406 TaxID=1173264 RepID=UPI0012DE1D39|nr:hypothetical protein [Leptolyngbya sp. PCC 6406]
MSLWVQTRPQEAWWWALVRFLLVSMGLTAAISAVSSLLWLSLVLLLRPQPPSWLGRYLPQTAASWGEIEPQIQTQIHQDIEAQGYQVGDWIDLTTWSPDPYLQGLWLLPVWTVRSPCQRDCEVLVELRLYGQYRQTPEGREFQQLDRLVLQSPTLATVLAPLVQADVEVPPTQGELPLLDLQPFDQPDLPGLWLTLTGRWQQGGQPVLYGQVVHIDPRLLGARSLLTWSSPHRQRPLWINLDHSGPPELVVDQSVGLEPGFRVYALAGGGTALISQRLVGISLLESSLEGAEGQNYDTALYLAQNGLWSLAQERLEAIKKRRPEQWSIETERQLQLVALHARVTQAQATGNWSQPSQKLLALLIDGRWEQALQELQEPSESLRTSILPLLAGDKSGRLWRRVTAALRVDHRRDAARLWGALLLLAKEDKATAEQWLAQAANGKPLKDRFSAIAARFATPTSDDPGRASLATPSQRDPANTPTALVPTAWAGTAQELSALTLDQWHPFPETAGTNLPIGQRWYQIQLQHQLLAPQWQPVAIPTTAPSPTTLGALWQRLGPAQSLELLPVTGNGSSTIVTVQAAQWQGNQLLLLATGPPVGNGPWLALAGGQFQPLTAVSGQSLGDSTLDWATTSSWLIPLAATWQLAANSPDEKLDRAPWGNGVVRQADLTGDGTPERIVTLPGQGTAILTAEGQILYQGSPDRPLTGWISGGSSVLLVESGSPPGFRAWSIPQQRFE